MFNFKNFLFIFFFSFCFDLQSIEIINYRFGLEKDINRIVIDINKNTEFKHFIKEKKLILEFKDEILRSKNFQKTNNTAIKNISVKDQNLLIIDFEKDIFFKKVFFIKKQNGKKPRIVIDFKELNKLNFKKKIIVIDAGHGGRDSGAIGVSGILEKKITLSFAKRIKNRLKKNKKFTIILTRNDDKYLQLRQRVGYARKMKADLFISLHADYHRNNNISGVSIYTLSEKASDKEAEALAKRENKEDLIDGLDLSEESKEVTNILIDLTQRETMNQSSYFVNFLIKELSKRTKLLQRTHRFAGFAVLKAPDIPSVLLEMGYLSNKKDSKLLMDKNYQEKLIDGIIVAMEKYFQWIENNKLN